MNVVCDVCENHYAVASVVVTSSVPYAANYQTDLCAGCIIDAPECGVTIVRLVTQFHDIEQTQQEEQPQ